MGVNVWRKQAFHASTTFREASIVVQQDLLQVANEHPDDVREFLSWMRSHARATKIQVLAKIEQLDRAVAEPLRLYSGFVLRFRVHLKLINRNGGLEIQQNYTRPRLSQLKAKVIGGKLIHPPLDSDEDCRYRFASIGGLPAAIRKAIKTKGAAVLLTQEREEADEELIRSSLISKAELDYLRQTQRARSSNPEDARLRFVEVDLEEASALAKLLDLAYDPVSITFLLVDSQRQKRLLCLVGELVTDRDWKQFGVVRAVFPKVISGKTSAGAPVDFDQFAKDIARLPYKGKIPNNLAIDAIGGEGIVDPTVFKNTEKRLQRAKLRRNAVRRQLAQ